MMPDPTDRPPEPNSIFHGTQQAPPNQRRLKPRVSAELLRAMDTLIDNTALTNKVLENLKDGASNASGSTSRPLLAIRERVASLAISMGVLGVSLAVILVATSFLMAATGTIQPSVIMVATMKVGGVAVATLILTGAVGLALGSEVKRSAQKLPD